MLPLRPGLAACRTLPTAGTATSRAPPWKSRPGRSPRTLRSPNATSSSAFRNKVEAVHPGVERHVAPDTTAPKSSRGPQAAREPENPRITLHFTPTGCSWLNMAEIFFGNSARQAIRGGSFRSDKELTTAIGAVIDAYNDRCQPFSGRRRRRRNGKIKRQRINGMHTRCGPGVHPERFTEASLR